MYKLIWIRFNHENTKHKTLLEAKKEFEKNVIRSYEDYRETKITLVGDENEYVIDYYGKIFAVIIKED